MAKKHGRDVSNSSFDKRLAQYGAMSLAIAGAAIGSPAQAATIYWNGHGATATPHGPGVNFNFFTGAVSQSGMGALGSFRLSAGTLGSLNQPLYVAGIVVRKQGFGGIFASHTSGAARNLGVGDLVGPFPRRSPASSILAAWQSSPVSLITALIRSVCKYSRHRIRRCRLQRQRGPT
jgi:hypothetical protein